MRLGGLYDAWPPHGILQVVERRGVRAVSGSVPLVIVDVLQLAFLRHVSDVHVRTVLVIRRRANGRGKGELILDIVRPATGRLPMGPKTARADVLLVAALAGIRPFVGVQPLVQLEVNELGEFRGAQVAGVGLLAGMQSQMSLEVGGRAEPLLADLALVRFLACMDEVMLLQVGKLRETLGANVTLERPLAGMSPQMYLEIRQLAERLAAHVALVMHLAVLLLQRVRQRPVTPRPLRVGAERAALRAGVVVRGQGARGRVSVEGGRGVGVDGEARMMAEVKIVRAGYQRLITVYLHRGRGRQLMAARRGLQPPPVRPLVHHVPARGRRIGGAIDGQRGHVVVQRAVLMVNTVRVGGGRLYGGDGGYALIAVGRRVRINGARLYLASPRARVEDGGRCGGRAPGRVRRRALDLPLGRASLVGRGRGVKVTRGREYRGGGQHARPRVVVVAGRGVAGRMDTGRPRMGL